MNGPWLHETWVQTPRPEGTDNDRLDELLARAFDPPSIDLGTTLSLLVVHSGMICVERYGETSGPDVPLISWSMAKSVTHALVGILIGDEKLELDAPAPVPAWREPGDPRGDITLAHLLSMSSGLRFAEDYDPNNAAGSDVIQMLMGAGAEDMDAFAHGFPMDHAVNTVSSYSSGTTNIITGIIGRAVGDGEAGMRNFMQERLFDPLGMGTADPRFDEAGTFVGSSYLFASARDFARFGLLYANEGMWGPERVLPVGWTQHAQARSIGPGGSERYWYANHWWLWDDPCYAYGAHGYEGQYTVIVPERDLVIVRLGKTPERDLDSFRDWLRDLISCFPSTV